MAESRQINLRRIPFFKKLPDDALDYGVGQGIDRDRGSGGAAGSGEDKRAVDDEESAVIVGQ